MKVEPASNELVKVLWYYNLIYDTVTPDHKIVCPFHDDVNPSMIVNLDRNAWYCFGCQESGDALKFTLMMESKYNGLNDLQGLAKYRRILKSRKCSNIKVSGRVKKKKRVRTLYNEAYDYYHGLKRTDWNSPECNEELEVYEYMYARGFTASTLNRLGARVTYSRQYQMIFPMLDNGKFKGWVSRTMIPEIAQKRKYLYNKGFSRATSLVGNYGSKDYVFVVEGYMDRAKFLQYGEDNVVAILGWKMSQLQEQKLKAAGVTKIISALDNDTCGKRGTSYLKTVAGFKVIRFRYLKGIKDPGDMTEEQFKKMYEKTMQDFEGSKERWD